MGGAYGVDKTILERADFTWSLSKLVFPHQVTMYKATGNKSVILIPALDLSRPEQQIFFDFFSAECRKGNKAGYDDNTKGNTNHARKIIN